MLEVALEARELVADVEVKPFLLDRVRVRALERMLELIGEAARRVTLERRANHPEIRWCRLIGQRNILALEYGRINPRVLYLTAGRTCPA